MCIFVDINTALRAFQVQSIEEHCLILQMASILNVVIEQDQHILVVTVDVFLLSLYLACTMREELR
jgi:hypothetical protein